MLFHFTPVSAKKREKSSIFFLPELQARQGASVRTQMPSQGKRLKHPAYVFILFLIECSAKRCDCFLRNV